MEISTGKLKKAMNLTLFAGTVKRSKLGQTLEYGCRRSVFVECLI